jgi:hypothetical protein
MSTEETMALLLSLGGSVFVFAAVGLLLVGNWKTYTKAGQPGWGSLVPFYNLYLITKIGRLSGWWFVGIFVPYVNMIAWPYAHYKVAQRFGCGIGMTLALLLGFGWLLLGFGNYTYDEAEG